MRRDHKTIPKWACPGSRDLISYFRDPLNNFWMNWAIHSNFDTEMEDGPRLHRQYAVFASLWALFLFSCVLHTMCLKISASFSFITKKISSVNRSSQFLAHNILLNACIISHFTLFVLLHYPRIHQQLNRHVVFPLSGRLRKWSNRRPTNSSILEYSHIDWCVCGIHSWVNTRSPTRSHSPQVMVCRSLDVCQLNQWNLPWQLLEDFDRSNS